MNCSPVPLWHPHSQPATAELVSSIHALIASLRQWTAQLYQPCPSNFPSPKPHVVYFDGALANCKPNDCFIYTALIYIHMQYTQYHTICITICMMHVACRSSLRSCLQQNSGHAHVYCAAAQQNAKECLMVLCVNLGLYWCTKRKDCTSATHSLENVCCM